jgi:hypothetical protein
MLYLICLIHFNEFKFTTTMSWYGYIIGACAAISTLIIGGYRRVVHSDNFRQLCKVLKAYPYMDKSRFIERVQDFLGLELSKHGQDHTYTMGDSLCGHTSEILFDAKHNRFVIFTTVKVNVPDQCIAFIDGQGIEPRFVVDVPTVPTVFTIKRFIDISGFNNPMKTRSYNSIYKLVFVTSTSKMKYININVKRNISHQAVRKALVTKCPQSI